MSAQWKSIAQNDALKHPLYGIKGWLLLFAIGNFIGPLMSWGRVNSIALEYQTTIGNLFSIDTPEITFLKAALYMELALAGVVLFMLFTKNANFRSVASWGRLLYWPILALIALFVGISETGNALAMTFFPWAVSCAVWVTYLQRSKRVRVTFESCVRALSTPDSKSPSNTSTTTVHHDIAPSVKSAAMVSSDLTKQTRPSSVQFDFTTFDEDAIYATVAEELESGKTDKGLWTRLFADCDGDEKQTKVLYIKRRAERLIEAEKQKRYEVAQQDLLQQKQEGEKSEEAEKWRRRNSGLADPNLINAVWNGDWSIASQLLESGVSPLGTNESGVSLPDLAKKRGDDQMFYLLKAHEAKTKGPKVEALISKFRSGTALTSEDVSNLVEVAEKFNDLVNMQDAVDGFTLLHWCALHDLHKPAATLLSIGADPFIKSNGSKTAGQLARNTALAMKLASTEKAVVQSI